MIKKGGYQDGLYAHRIQLWPDGPCRLVPGTIFAEVRRARFTATKADAEHGARPSARKAARTASSRPEGLC